jgi:Plasmid pRiA4b ORF-3-like protein
MNAATIAHLKITLDDVKPSILRRIEVPFDIRLDRLHLTIQAAMGWTNSHLYEIRVGDVAWSAPYPDQDWAGDFLDARKARLSDVLEDAGTKTLKYLYDFGDGWKHTIKVERLIDPESGVLYPRLIAAKGHCPPEDVGGPWGYSEFLEAIADPSHERHNELKEWFADDFNPHVVDVDWLSQDVAELAERWSRQPAVKRRRSA